MSQKSVFLQFYFWALKIHGLRTHSLSSVQHLSHYSTFSTSNALNYFWFDISKLSPGYNTFHYWGSTNGLKSVLSPNEVVNQSGDHYWNYLCDCSWYSENLPLSLASVKHCCSCVSCSLVNAREVVPMKFWGWKFHR